MTNPTDPATGADSGSPDVRPTSDEFARVLRQRAESAAAASVHHASLSQQYLVLSQKFDALAEQADRGSLLHLSQLLAQLDREAQVGQPAPPIGVPLVRPAPATVPTVHVDGNADDPIVQREDTQLPVADSEIITTSISDSVTSAVPAIAATPKPPKTTQRRKKRVRELAERLRLLAPQILDRVRVRARRNDLKPRLRTTTEELKKSRGSLVISIVVLIIVMAAMGMMQLQIENEDAPTPLIASFSVEPTPVEEAQPIEPPAEVPGEQSEMETEVAPEKPPEEPTPEPEPAVEPEPAMTAEASEPEPAAETAADIRPLPESPKGTEALAAAAAAGNSRSAESRQTMLQKYGGSAASESAVGLALEWLASRQRRDGSWDFNDVGTCSSPGTTNNPIGGTAYALLPFLSAGQTHKDKNSPFRTQIEAGLSYLLAASVVTPAGLDLRGVLNKGNKDKEPNEAYYVHGTATLALCEAYAMTKDRRLKAPAENAVLFLLNSQDPNGGGWRYLPQQPGSTSVTAVQIMALTSARKAGFNVPDAAFKGAMHYLDGVQVDKAGRYGYEIEKKTYQASVTAMALLSRMSLGWGREDGDLREGVALLSKRGPYDNLYYNYFATQVLRNWGGEEWQQWNLQLRDDLITWQEKTGDARGSWVPRDRDDYSRAGGRLLSTVLATLTLEVYYRYQPLLPELNQAPTITLPLASESPTPDTEMPEPKSKRKSVSKKTAGD